MKDRLDAPTGTFHGCHILDVPLNGFNAKLGKKRIVPAGESANFVTSSDELPRDVLA